eukprot:6491906-Amphidinium_carterae.3
MSSTFLICVCSNSSSLEANFTSWSKQVVPDLQAMSMMDAFGTDIQAGPQTSSFFETVSTRHKADNKKT